MAATIFFDHLDEPGKYLPAYLFGLVCVGFGSVLVWIAHNHFTMRKQRINDYFGDGNDQINSD